MKTKDMNYLVSVYKELLEKGDVQVAYAELVKYIQRLKTTFSKDMGDEYYFGNVFQGYMDYTYFYISNDYLKKQKLKLGLVFNHNEVRFEIWLLGQTKDVQKKYWKLLKNTKWVRSAEIPQYSIFEAVLVNKPDFNNLDLLTEKLEKKLVVFSNQIFRSLRLIG